MRYPHFNFISVGDQGLGDFFNNALTSRANNFNTLHLFEFASLTEGI